MGDGFWAQEEFEVISTADQIYGITGSVSRWIEENVMGAFETWFGCLYWIDTVVREIWKDSSSY